jgi:hypothetical protein
LEVRVILALVKLMPESSREATFWVVLGVALASASGYVLFVKLDVLHVPGLFHYFPQAYLLLIALLISGVFFTSAGAYWLVRKRR